MGRDEKDEPIDGGSAMSAASPVSTSAAEEATLAEILSTAAHDLRQPATVIYGLATTLTSRRGLMGPDALEDTVRRIEQQATRLVRLLDDLLDASRLGAGTFDVQLRDVDLSEAIETAVSLAPPPEGRRLRLGFADGVAVVADPTGLERVLVNLLTNAYRYGGTNVLIEATAGDSSVTVSVVDDGGGVPLALVPHLFKPFRAEAGGIGVGLSIVRGLVEAFGGSITYRQAEPSGARFEMRLAAAASHRQPEPVNRYAGDPGGAVTILVVDDEPDVLFLLRLTLEAAGYSVVEAAHGAEALETIHEHPPSLVITDLMMPVMDGRELIHRVRSEPDTAEIPIVLLSANPDQNAGADRVMRKPFNPRDLTRVIDEMMGGAA